MRSLDRPLNYSVGLAFLRSPESHNVAFLMLYKQAEAQHPEKSSRVSRLQRLIRLPSLGGEERRRACAASGRFSDVTLSRSRSDEAGYRRSSPCEPELRQTRGNNRPGESGSGTSRSASQSPALWRSRRDRLKGAPEAVWLRGLGGL